MNVLIVDDNANNRMILKLFLEEYEEENKDVSFEIKEAHNGLVAVEMCKNENFNIVLMDIMMPEMDGIEATKIIRDLNQNIMIIAVSAVDDNVRQKLILNNGAEDYISKPVSADIFRSRIFNYIRLIEARSNKKTTESKYKLNLFTKKVYSRYTNFIINSEDSLSEFWEFFLLNAHAKYDNLSDVVRTIFSIAETQLRLSVESEIFVEESDEYQYFTLTKLDKLSPKIVEQILDKNLILCPYKIDGEKISFELAKIDSMAEQTVAPVIEKTVQEKQPEVSLSHEAPSEPQKIPSHKTSKELQVFHYMDEEDLVDLEEYSNKLSSLMLIVGSGDISEQEIAEMYTFLEKIGSVLSTYSEVYPISKALTNLSQDLATHKEEFMQNSQALGPMCRAFSNDMSTWMNMSFKTGAPSVDFMNDTIVVNCETISGMLKMNDHDDSMAEELDDIFDF